jgi:trimeric autotransporter adhesin
MVAFIISVCGNVTAAGSIDTKYMASHENSKWKVISDTKLNSTSSCQGDPIINGTVTISEYGHTRVLPNATITVKNTAGRTLATTTTNNLGQYNVNFYSTATQFNVIASYMGCASVTQTVNVSAGPNYPTDPNYYGTSNFQLTPYSVTISGTGTGYNVYVQGQDKNDWAGTINVKANGNSYTAYCIDLFTPISTTDTLLVNGPLPGTAGDLSQGVDWGKVNYIIKNYTASSKTEAAAIQCAIWYYTSAIYGAYPGTDPSHPGYYQFMTAPNDGKIGGATGSTTVRTRAFQIINAAQSIVYPSTVTTTPDITRIPNGGSSTITATVKDNNGNPLSGITVNFTKVGSGASSGTLSVTSGVTNALGQISTVLSGMSNNSSVTVTAAVSGNYGNLLYDDKYATSRKQNLVAINLLPSVVSDISIINVDSTANVSLSKSVNSPVNVNDPVTFTITATNNGPNAATGLMISDLAPAGLLNVTYTPSVGTYYNGIWTITTLNNGSSATLTIRGIASSSMAGKTTTNTATRIAQNEYNSQPATATASVYTKIADVNITKTASNNNPKVGQQFYYTITLNNSGLDPATNVFVTDLLNSGLTFNSYSATQGSYSNGIWNVGTLNVNVPATLTIYVTPKMSSAGQSITNTATETQTEYDPTPATAQATVNVPKAVQLTKTGDYATYCGKIIWRINVENTTNEVINNVVVNDLINGHSYSSYWNYYISYNGGIDWAQDGTYNPTTGNWTINTLPVGAEYVLAVYVTPLNGTSKNYSNTATYNDQSATATVYVPDNQINITKTGQYNSTYNLITWRINVTNSGNDPANLAVWDMMGYESPNTQYVSYRVSYDNGATWVQDGSYNPEYGEWDISGLEKTETFILEINATPLNGNGTYTNTAYTSTNQEASASVIV